MGNLFYNSGDFYYTKNTEMLMDMGVDIYEFSPFASMPIRVTARNVGVQTNRYVTGFMAIRGTINSIDFTYCLNRSVIIQIHSQTFSTFWTVDHTHYRNVALGTARVTGIVNWGRDHTFDGRLVQHGTNGVPRGSNYALSNFPEKFHLNGFFKN